MIFTKGDTSLTAKDLTPQECLDELFIVRSLCGVYSERVQLLKGAKKKNLEGDLKALQDWALELTEKLEESLPKAYLDERALQTYLKKNLNISIHTCSDLRGTVVTVKLHLGDAIISQDTETVHHPERDSL